MSRDTVEMPQIFMEIVEMTRRLGVFNVKELPGCWECQVDDDWWLAVNGHSEPCWCSHNLMVQPYEAYVEFNGWPWAILSPYDGGMLQAEAANEDSLIAALRARGT